MADTNLRTQKQRTLSKINAAKSSGGKSAVNGRLHARTPELPQMAMPGLDDSAFRKV